MLLPNKYFTLPSGKIIDLSQIIEICPPDASSPFSPYGTYQYVKQPAYYFAKGEYELISQAVIEYGECEAKFKNDILAAASLFFESVRQFIGSKQ